MVIFWSHLDDAAITVKNIITEFDGENALDCLVRTCKVYRLTLREQ